MLRRGIPATPVLNGYCGDYEFGMEKSVVYESVFNYGWPNQNDAKSSLKNLSLFSFIILLCLAMFNFKLN